MKMFVFRAILQVLSMCEGHISYMLTLGQKMKEEIVFKP